jgi:hypothetical protein
MIRVRHRSTVLEGGIGQKMRKIGIGGVQNDSVRTVPALPLDP